jgi:hypothetical protein
MVGHQAGGTVFLIGKFRVLVNITPPSNHLVFDCGNTGFDRCQHTVIDCMGGCHRSCQGASQGKKKGLELHELSPRYG